MEDKILGTGDFIASIKRSEFILERILMQLIAIRHNKSSDEELSQSFQKNLEYVASDVKEFFESLRNAEQ